MVATYREGSSVREVAKQFKESKSTVQRWVKFAHGKRLDRISFEDKKRGPQKPKNQTRASVEQRVLRIRKNLKDKSILGCCGADAILREMKRCQCPNLPSRRTIGYILKRHGMIDKRQRVRRSPPPPGWYLSDLHNSKVELDSFDIVEGLYLKGGNEIQLLNGISIHGSLILSDAMETVTTENTILRLIEHWKIFGLPKYAQFDNDMVFQGSRRPNMIGKVIRVCLSLGVTPVFATPYEQGFQGKIERFNKEVQEKFWRRHHFKNLKDITNRLEIYVQAHRLEHQEKILAAPRRRAFPKHWKRDDTKPPKGKIVYLRRTNGSGYVRILENEIFVSEHWVNRLVRAELDIEKETICFFALRRSEWKLHRLLLKIPFSLKKNIER